MKVVNRQLLYDGHYKLYKVTLEHEGETFDREVFRTGVAVAGLVYWSRFARCILRPAPWRKSAESINSEIPIERTIAYTLQQKHSRLLNNTLSTGTLFSYSLPEPINR